MVKYSIVIPTFNRVETLAGALRTALEQPGDNFEVIVHDNASSDGTKEYLSTLSHPRLRCFSNPEPVDMTENWTLALEKVDAEYVFFMGDDDAIMPNALTEMDQYLETFPGVDVVGWGRYNYGWPSALPAMRNRLYIYFQQGHDLIDQKDRLRMVVDLDLNHEFLPMIYNSFVSTKLIKKVIDHCGKYFVVFSPDLSSGVVNLCFAEKILFTYKSLSMIGTSGKSNGAAFINMKLADVDTIKANIAASSTPNLHPLLDVGVKQGLQIRQQSMLNTYLMSMQAAGVPVEINGAKIIPKIINSVFDDRVYDTEVNREYCQKLAARFGLGVNWPQAPVYASEVPHINNFGPAFRDGQMVSVNIDTARIGITDVYHASLLAEMLTRKAI